MSSKSVKKHNSKKQSVPRHNSHYFILMGNPVEGRQHGKGLGMVLSSAHGTKPAKERHYEKQFPSETNMKPDPDLATSLQESWHPEPSKGYSYTEALFTGRPLLNGKAPAESDDTEGKEEYGGINRNPDQEVDHEEKSNQKLKDKALFKQHGYGGYEIEQENYTFKGMQRESSPQRQMEVHTGEGVATPVDEGHNSDDGVSSTFASNQSTRQGSSTPDRKPEDILIGRKPGDNQGYDSHQYVIPRPSMYKSGRFIQHWPWEDNPKENPKQQASQQQKIPEVSERPQAQLKQVRRPPVESSHQRLLAYNTHENSDSASEGGGTQHGEDLKEGKSGKIPESSHEESLREESGAHEDFPSAEVNETGANFQPQVEASSNKGTGGLYSGKPGDKLSARFGHEEFFPRPEVVQLKDLSKEAANKITLEPLVGEPIIDQQSHEHKVSNQSRSNGQIASDSGIGNEEALDVSNELHDLNGNESFTFMTGRHNNGISNDNIPGNQDFPHKIITSSSEKEVTQKFITGPSQVTTGVSIKQSTHKQITHVSNKRVDTDLSTKSSDDVTTNGPVHPEDATKITSQSSFGKGNNALIIGSQNEWLDKGRQEPSAGGSLQDSGLESDPQRTSQEHEERPRLGGTTYPEADSDALETAQREESKEAAPNQTADENSKYVHTSSAHQAQESAATSQNISQLTQPENLMQEQKYDEPSKDYGSASTVQTDGVSAKDEEHEPLTHVPEEVQVRIPEMTSTESDATKVSSQPTSENSKYNYSYVYGRVSEGIREREPTLQDKNQEIVYYVKMAKGIPLLHGEVPYQDHKLEKGAHERNYEQGPDPNNVNVEKEQHMPENDDGKNDKNGELYDRRYRWRWWPKLVGSAGPRPSAISNSSPSPSPHFSPNPIPSPLGGEGAVGGSSVDTDRKQGKHSY